MYHDDDVARAGSSRTAPAAVGHPRGHTSTAPARRAALPGGGA